jgi:hypothetical protein
MDKVQKPNNFDSYTPLSELFIFYDSEQIDGMICKPLPFLFILWGIKILCIFDNPKWSTNVPIILPF